MWSEKENNVFAVRAIKRAKELFERAALMWCRSMRFLRETVVCCPSKGGFVEVDAAVIEAV